MPKHTFRIGHLIGSLNIGGAERLVVNLCNELPPGQATVITLITRPGSLAQELRLDTQVYAGAVRWRTLPLDMIRLVFLLRRLKLDVLQTHMFWANLAGVIAGRLAGVPVIVTAEHGTDAWKRWGSRWIERHIISRLADKRVCVSEEIRQLRHTLDGVSMEKLCVICNGSPIREQKRLEERSPVVLGTLGRLVQAKDYPTLIQAAKLLRDEGFVFRLEIIGDGPERAKLLAEIDRYQLKGVVELPGFSTDLEGCLDRFDIYVCSSILEGQPVALLEAMSVGLPIVATNVGGIPATISDGHDGLIVPPRDPRAMMVALARMIRDDPLRRRLGAGARQRLINDFSTATSLRRYLALYEELFRQKFGDCESSGLG